MKIIANAEPTLTQAEMQLIRAYRNFCDDTQEFMCDFFENMLKSKDNLRSAPKHALRLVAGGAA